MALNSAKGITWARIVFFLRSNR